MFYAKNPDADKQFQIDATQVPPQRPGSKKQSKPPAPAPSAKQLPRQESLLKEAGAKALNYPQITHDILDQHLANNILKDLGHALPGSEGGQVEQYLNQHKFKGQSPSRSPLVKDNDMLTQMAQRLAKLERLCNAQKLELKEKSEYIFDLKDQLESLKGTQGKDQVENLLDENKKLKLQVKEMEVFLGKYGVKWVGHTQDEKLDGKMKQLASDATASKSKYHYHLPKEISIDVITRRVEELNYIVEKEGATQIYKNAQGMHQIKKMDPLPIGFYRNGIAMKGFKFFSYGSNDSYQILADILDGYYPYQLKQQYPNGTLLKVVDKTEEMFVVDTNQKQVDLLSYEQRQFQPQTKEEFLDKLPKHVIKDGKIIPIRSEIAKKFEPQQHRPVPANARLDEEDGRTLIVLTQAQRVIDEGSVYDQDLMCTLKFRTETGRDTLFAVMFCSQTIAEMYEQVRSFAENTGTKLEIIQNFPRVTFDPSSVMTLEEAGLHPNAQLFFK